MSSHSHSRPKNPKIPNNEPVDLFKSKAITLSYRKDNPLIPRLTTDPQFLDQLMAPWMSAIAVKVLGKSVDYNSIFNEVSIEWEPDGNFQILDLGLGYFVIRFELQSDLDWVLDNGPWTIEDCCVSVRPYTADFRASEAKIDRISTWVRFPELSLMYYNENFLRGLSTVIGRPVKVSLDVKSPQLSKVCVEFDLSKPLVEKFYLNNKELKVEYEGLRPICSHCRFYGHTVENCLGMAKMVAPAATEDVEMAAPEAVETKPKCRSGCVTVKTRDQYDEVYFRIKRVTKLGKLFDAYYKHHAVEPESCAFFFGDRISPEQTPYELAMKDGDEIDVFFHQAGCESNVAASREL